MFKNYFKTAWRSLKTNKFYTTINIIGLAVGLASGIMLLLWVQNEKSYDKFNNDYQNIYELSDHFRSNGKEVAEKEVPGPLAVFAKSIPQVRSLVRIYDEWGQVLANSNRQKVLDGFHIAYVDSSFLSIFDFKLLKGNRTNLFPNISSVVLTQSTAKKFFGDSDAMEKTIIFNGNNFTVTGILQGFPDNSSLHYDAIFPIGFYGQQFTANGGNGAWKTIDEDLGNYVFNVFVALQPGANPAIVGSIFTSLIKKANNGDSDDQFKLQNLADIHLTGTDGNDSALRMVQIFILIAILLLVIAAINYVNLSTARSLIRAKEVSIRKIVGANKRQLFFQFIIETFLLFSIATVVAFISINLLMPLYNKVSGKELHFSLGNVQVLKTIVCAFLGTLLAASVYPAILLSSFRPIQSLKGKVTSGIGTTLFRKMLVVFQFAISVILIVSTLVISHQMQYVRNKDLGYDKSYVFTVSLTNNAVKHIDALKNELRKQSGIVNASTSNINDISNLTKATDDIDWQGKSPNNNLTIAQASIDKDFIPTMQMQLIEGKNFSGSPADDAHYILNEAAVKAMGLKLPYVGQQISFHERKGTIIGVLKDFNFKSLKEKITPLLFSSRQFYENILYIRTTAKDAQQAIVAVEQQYKKYGGDIPFSYSFVDKQFEAKYKTDQRSGILFKVFAGIAILISCLGLFGLATYTAEVKRKEIGIRKVLGSSVSGIVQMISKDFLKLIIISIIIAIPIGWWAMNKWLEGFAYRVNISWGVFAIAGVLALLIALLTVSFQAIKAAVANPVESLRSE